MIKPLKWSTILNTQGRHLQLVDPSAHFPFLFLYSSLFKNRCFLVKRIQSYLCLCVCVFFTYLLSSALITAYSPTRVRGDACLGGESLSGKEINRAPSPGSNPGLSPSLPRPFGASEVTRPALPLPARSWAHEGRGGPRVKRASGRPRALQAAAPPPVTGAAPRHAPPPPASPPLLRRPGRGGAAPRGRSGHGGIARGWRQGRRPAADPRHSPRAGRAGQAQAGAGGDAGQPGAADLRLRGQLPGGHADVREHHPRLGPLPDQPEKLQQQERPSEPEVQGSGAALQQVLGHLGGCGQRLGWSSGPAD